MNGQMRIMQVLNHQLPDRVPVYEVLIDPPAVEQVLHISGKTSWDLTAEELVRLYQALGLDGLVVPLRNWKPKELKRDRIAPDRLTAPSSEDVEKSITRCRDVVRAAHEAGLAVAAYSHGCFDVAYEGMGFENFMTELADDFDYIDALIQRLFEYHRDLVRQAAQTQVDWILIGDDVAYRSGLFIHPDQFFRLWFDREKAIIDEARQVGKPVEFHTDGKIEAVLPHLIEMGVDLVNPVEPYSNDIVDLKHRYGDRIGFRGNVDIAGVLAFGTSEETYQATKDLVLQLKPGGNYVCSSSHSLSSAVRLDNYAAMVRAVYDYGRYE